MILNRYKVDDTVVSESCSYTVKARLQPLKIICLVSILICLYLIMVVPKGMELPLVMALIFMLLFRIMVLPLLEKRTIARFIESMRQKTRGTYGKKALWEEVRIADGKVTTYTNKIPAFSFPVTDLLKVHETDDLFVTLFRGNKVLTLRKDSFYEGSEAEFRELVKAINKKGVKIVQKKSYHA